MENQVHSITNLFDQLGLPSHTKDIQIFIELHRPLSPNLKLPDAPFWTTSQARFLREKITDDADWSAIVDQLDARLR